MGDVVMVSRRCMKADCSVTFECSENSPQRYCRQDHDPLIDPKKPWNEYTGPAPKKAGTRTFLPPDQARAILANRHKMMDRMKELLKLKLPHKDIADSLNREGFQNSDGRAISVFMVANYSSMLKRHADQDKEIKMSFSQSPEEKKPAVDTEDMLENVRVKKTRAPKTQKVAKPVNLAGRSTISVILDDDDLSAEGKIEVIRVYQAQIEKNLG